MEFNAKKCHVLEIGKSTMSHSWTYNLGQNITSIVKEVKNLEVLINRVGSKYK